MRLSSLVCIMLNASTPLFHQHLVFMVYESPLVLWFVTLSTKVAFVNLKKLLNISLSVRAYSLATRLFSGWLL